MKIALKNMLDFLNALHNQLDDPSFSCAYLAVEGHAFPACARFPLEALEEAVGSAGLTMDGSGFECDMVPFKRLLGLLQNLNDYAQGGLMIEVQDMVITGEHSTADQLSIVEIACEDSCDIVAVKIRWPYVMEEEHALQILYACAKALNFAMGTFHYEELSEEDEEIRAFDRRGHPRSCFRRANRAKPEEDLWFGNAFCLPCLELYSNIRQLLLESDSISRKLAHVPEDEKGETP